MVLVVAGTILEGIGLVIAVRGLASLKSDLFPGRPLPAARALRFVRRKLRRRPANVVLAVASSELGFGSSAQAVVQTLPAPPDGAAPAEEWVPYLLKRIENAEELAHRRHADVRKWNTALGERIDVEQGERIRRDAELEGRVLTAVGGEDGRGLDQTWWGLVVTLIGVILEAIGSVLAA